MKKAELAARNKILEHQHEVDQKCIKRAVNTITALEVENRVLKARLGLDVESVPYQCTGS